MKMSETKLKDYLKYYKDQFESGVNPTQLMNEMESIFKIPALNDEMYNTENSEVIELYRTISDSRFGD